MAYCRLFMIQKSTAGRIKIKLIVMFIVTHRRRKSLHLMCDNKSAVPEMKYGIYRIQFGTVKLH